MEKEKRNKFSSLLKAAGLTIPDDISELLLTVAHHVQNDIEIDSKQIQSFHDKIIEVRINQTVEKFEREIKEYDSTKHDHVKLARTLARILLEDSDEVINNELIKVKSNDKN
jgi:hypothetical protein